MACTFDFAGLKVLVTGASQGIGRGIALALSRCGAHVVALARDNTALQQLRHESGDKMAVVACDVSWGREDIERALRPHQPFNHLVNSAGIARCDPFLQMKQDDFKSVLHTNVVGAATVSQVVAQGMIEHQVRGNKCIVHVSSQLSQFTAADHTAYAASKCALDSLCRSMALELAQWHIRVNTVNPTVVMTAMGRAAWDNDSQRSRHMKSRIPLGRWAEVDEVVNAVLWLLSDGATMTTGAAVPVDGGAIMA